MTEEQRRLRQQLWNIANTLRGKMNAAGMVFRVIVEQQTRTKRNDAVVTPITKSLIGIIKHSKIDESDYQRYLQDKYL
jgi:type I restriction-modification system DNA methylase subunit